MYFLHVFIVFIVFNYARAEFPKYDLYQAGGESHSILKRNVGAYSTPYPVAYSGSPGVYPSYPTPVSYYPTTYSCPSCNTTEDCDECYMGSPTPCTKSSHETGCVVQTCTAEDTLLIDYTCYCSPYFPQGCVFPMNGESPCQNEATTYACECNGPRKSPTWCSLGVCDSGEQTSATTTCVCGDTTDKQPCGCVKQTASGSLSVQAVQQSRVLVMDVNGEKTLVEAN